MLAMIYTSLPDPEWRAHPLNRLSGPMIAVLAWAGFQLAFAVLLLLGFLTEGPGFIFLDGVPDTYEWVLWGAMIAGPFVIVPAIFLRARAVPLLYAGYIGVTFLLLLGAEMFELNWLSAARYASMDGTVEALIFALAVTIDLIVIRYLFVGARPNVIFHHRALA